MSNNQSKLRTKLKSSIMCKNTIDSEFSHSANSYIDVIDSIKYDNIRQGIIEALKNKQGNVIFNKYIHRMYIDDKEFKRVPTGFIDNFLKNKSKRVCEEIRKRVKYLLDDCVPHVYPIINHQGVLTSFIHYEFDCDVTYENFPDTLKREILCKDLGVPIKRNGERVYVWTYSYGITITINIRYLLAD